MANFEDDNSAFDKIMTNMNKSPASETSLLEIITKAELILSGQPETERSVVQVRVPHPLDDEVCIGYVQLQTGIYDTDILTSFHVAISDEPEADSSVDVLFQNGRLAEPPTYDGTDLTDILAGLEHLARTSLNDHLAQVADQSADYIQALLTPGIEPTHTMPSADDMLYLAVMEFIDQAQHCQTTTQEFSADLDHIHVEIEKRTDMYCDRNNQGEKTSVTVKSTFIKIQDYSKQTSYSFSQLNDSEFTLERGTITSDDNDSAEVTINQEAIESELYEELYSTGMFSPSQDDANFIDNILKRCLTEKLEKALKQLTEE